MTPTDLAVFENQAQKRFGLAKFNINLTHLGDLKLHDIIVPRGKRGEGLGTKAMTALCELADREGLRIVLEPASKTPGATTSRARLVRFYKRFGFVENKGRNKDFEIMIGMYRQPVIRGIESGWEPYGVPHRHPDKGAIHLYRKGQACRWYKIDGGVASQVGPQQKNAAPAVAWALMEGYR